MAQRFSALVVVMLGVTDPARAGAAHATLPLDQLAAYSAFRLQYRAGEDATEDHVDYATRASLFQARSEDVAAHNARPGVSWRKAVNRFSDHTDAELRGMLGYKRKGHLKAPTGGSGSFLEVRPSKRAWSNVSVDWRGKLNSSQNFLRDQGGCGSCWAVAAVGALEMHAEAEHGATERLSFEELVDCVPNPKHCGGDGGCKGATAELAFQYVQEHGLSAADSYKGYMSGGDGKCRASQTSSEKTTRATGWERLPENKLDDLLEAVANRGPAVVSVDASGWSSYGGGVFDECEKDATVNHAVVVVGFGSDEASGKDFWLIRNSWGPGWGEDGYIRLQRHASDKGDAGHCGTDRSPQEGVGCQGGPKELPVCGMCGVLSDSSLPKGVVISGRKALAM
jgi:cathepsin L